MVIIVNVDRRLKDVTQLRSAKATINDVARLAGVSRATVSRVLNGKPGTSWPVRRRVHWAAAELDYRPNENARSLASGRQSAVDLIAIDSSSSLALGAHPYYSRVLAGVVTALQTVNVQLHLQVIPENLAPERIDALADNATKGAIFANVTPGLALRFFRRCRKVISLVPTASIVPAVEADNTGGAFNAVEHLHKLGRRRIAAIHGPALNTCAIDRRTGYRQATQALALTDLSADGGFTPEGGYAAALRLLGEHPDIDAMFVACDVMATGAVQAIVSTGRRVPHDVCVIGFDDSYVAICNNPALTTMRVPIEDMAVTATRTLLTGTIPACHRQRFPVELVQRDSTIRHPHHSALTTARKTPHLHTL